MQLQIIESTRRVFEFLDDVMRENGLYLFIGLVYLLIPITVWTLINGRRRKLSRRKFTPNIPPVLVIYHRLGSRQQADSFDPFPPLRDLPACDREEL